MSALERFRAAALAAGYRIPSGRVSWRMPCPGHGGDGANLSVAAGDRGVVLTCHSHGCAAETIARAVGLSLPDLFDIEMTPTVADRWRQVDVYPYEDEDARLLFEVVRSERGEAVPGKKAEKSFGQRHVLPDGRRVWGLNGTRRVLFRLPQVIEAVAHERAVLVVEGEKCVLAAERLGVVATTAPMGAGKWLTRGQDEHGYSAALRGAHVVLAPDQDEKGLRHMLEIGEQLTRTAASVRVLELPRLGAKEDLADWVERGGDARQLAALLEAARPFEDWRRSLAQATAPEGEQGEGTTQDHGLPRPKLLAEVDPTLQIEWSVEELLVAGEMGFLGGPDGVSKTTVVLHIACGIAGGRPVFGRFATRQGTVLFISGEDPEPVLRNRAEAICRGQGWSSTEVLSQVHVLALAGVDLRDRAWQAHLLALVEELKPVLVVLDPYFELVSGDENSNSDARAIVHTLRALTQPSAATVLVVHHFKKASEGVSKTDLFRGASAPLKASRMTYSLERGPEGDLLVDNVKFTRAAKREPFALRPTIVTDEANEAVWRSARFDYVSAEQARFDAADGFVVKALGDGIRLTTSDLKDQAKGTGVSGADIARALRSLTMRKRIDFEPGPRGAKLWGLLSTTLPGNLGKVKTDLAGQPATLPGNLFPEPSTLPTPLRGVGGKVGGSGERGDHALFTPDGFA